MRDLTGKTFLVTGATSGFGQATAIAALKAGARVIVAGRRKDRLKTLHDTYPEYEMISLSFDVRNPAAVEDAISSLPDAWKQIDVLVNNAGLALNTATADKVPLEDWETMIDTNIKGLLYVTRAVLPDMIVRNHGHIITIGSMAGNYAYKGGNVYGGTKAFVKQFALNLRTDLLGTNIRVTNLEPGLAETEFSLVRFHGNEEAARDVYKDTLPLSAEDIAEAVLWCASLPRHVNINSMEIMPTCQAPGGLAVARS